MNPIFQPGSFRLPDSVTTIIAGDSHAMTAFNAMIIENAFNASFNSESYFQTYNKINLLVNSNPQIKTIILSYSFHNLAIFENSLICYGDKYFKILDAGSKNIIKNGYDYGFIGSVVPAKNGLIVDYATEIIHYVKYYALLLKHEIGLPFDVEKNLNIYIKQKMNRKLLTDYSFFREPYISKGNNLSEQIIEESILRHFGKTRLTYDESWPMKYYLEKISKLCLDHGIKIILVNTPLYSSYSERVPNFFKNLNSCFADELTNKYKNIVYWDYSDITLAKDHYGDGDHLNEQGMNHFSKIIRQRLQQNAN